MLFFLFVRKSTDWSLHFRGHGPFFLHSAEKRLGFIETALSEIVLQYNNVNNN